MRGNLAETAGHSGRATGKPPHQLAATPRKDNGRRPVFIREAEPPFYFLQESLQGEHQATEERKPPRRLRQERVAPYSLETQEAIAAFIGELAAMPPDVLLLFQSIQKGEGLREIAELRSQSEAETRAAIAEADRCGRMGSERARDRSGDGRKNGQCLK